MMIPRMLALPLLLLVGSFAMAEDTLQLLFDLTGADAAKEWQPVNDGVMGCVSEGKFRITDKNTLEFFGTLSLENNGGFASVRTRAMKLGLEKGDTVVAKVRGDGREYTLSLYLNKPLIAFSYRATVQTRKDEWIEVQVPLEEFEATSFGRVVKDAGQVDPKEVNALGFMPGVGTVIQFMARHDGKHFPKAISSFGDPLMRIFRRRSAHSRLRSLARNPSHVSLSAVSRRLADH